VFDWFRLNIALFYRLIKSFTEMVPDGRRLVKRKVEGKTMERLRELAIRLESPAYAALRVAAGAMLSMHGMQKLLGWFGAQFQPAVGTQLWLGGIIEVVAGLLIAVGLFTRPAAVLAAGTMAVAYVQFHWKLQLGGGAWAPIVNKGELAALYSLVFLFIAGHGPGVLSLAALRGRGGDRSRTTSVSGGRLVPPFAGEHRQG
jgi:putative oxidoreductase